MLSGWDAFSIAMAGSVPPPDFENTQVRDFACMRSVRQQAWTFRLDLFGDGIVPDFGLEQVELSLATARQAKASQLIYQVWIEGDAPVARERQTRTYCGKVAPLWERKLLLYLSAELIGANRSRLSDLRPDCRSTSL